MVHQVQLVHTGNNGASVVLQELQVQAGSSWFKWNKWYKWYFRCFVKNKQELQVQHGTVGSSGNARYFMEHSNSLSGTSGSSGSNGTSGDTQVQSALSRTSGSSVVHQVQIGTSGVNAGQRQELHVQVDIKWFKWYIMVLQVIVQHQVLQV